MSGELNLTKTSTSIGEGAYSKVFATNDAQYVCKKFRLEHYDETGLCPSFLREVSAIITLKTSPYVIDLTDIQLQNGTAMIFMPRFESDLKNFISSHAMSLDADQIRLIIFQILKGLYDAFSLGIWHRDLKPQNLLIDQKHEKVVICDWGLSRFTSTDYFECVFTQPVQTLWYRSPELLLGKKDYTCKIDMWSLGIILCELINGHIFVPGDTDIDQLFRIFRILGTPNEQTWPGVTHYDNFKTSYPVWAPTDLKTQVKTQDPHCLDLLAKMLTLDPNQRIDVVNALNHPYFDSLRPQPFNDINMITNLLTATQVNPVIDAQYLVRQTEVTEKMRWILFDWLMECNKVLIKTCSRTLLLAYYYVDLALSKLSIGRGRLQLVGCTCLHLATKVGDICFTDIADYVYICDNVYTKEDFLDMELTIVKAFDYNLYCMTEYAYLKLFNYHYEHIESFHHKTSYLLRVMLTRLSFRRYRSHEIALATILYFEPQIKIDYQLFLTSKHTLTEIVTELKTVISKWDTSPTPDRILSFCPTYYQCTKAEIQQPLNQVASDSKNEAGSEPDQISSPYKEEEKVTLSESHTVSKIIFE